MMDLFRSSKKRERLLERAPEGPLRNHLAVPWPERSRNVHDVRLVALDFETTGLDPQRDEIVSAGWVELKHGRIALDTARHRTTRTDGPISAASATVHGISDDRAAQGVALETVLEEVLSVLAGAVLVAHHASLDAAFLEAACVRCYGRSWAGPAIDTLAVLEGLMRRRQKPIREGALRLAAARRSYGLPHYPEHDALWDAIAAAELWLAIAEDLRGTDTLPLARVQRILP
jgi:DNA polymerase-3 subunit epsilon